MTAQLSRRRLVVFGALWLTVSGAVLLAPGCYGRNCEGNLETFGTNGGEGRMLDENTWESSPQDGKWLPFPRQRYYVFDVRALGGRPPMLVIPYLSASPEPTKGGDFTIGAGNLALFGNAFPNRVDIRNDSCSDYYLRLVVIAAPEPPAATLDAQAAAPELDSGVADAADGGSDQ